MKLVLILSFILIPSQLLVDDSLAQTALPTENKTQSVQISATTTDNGDIHVVLSNQSASAITGYIVTYGSLSIFRNYYPGSGSEIRPGATREETFTALVEPVDGLGANARTLALTCATFTDGSAEGEERDLAKIASERAAESIQMKRGERLLVPLAYLRPEQLPVALEKVIADIDALPETLDDGSAPMDTYGINGLRGGRTVLKSGLRSLLDRHRVSRGDLDLPSEVDRLRSHWRSRAVRPEPFRVRKLTTK